MSSDEEIIKKIIDEGKPETEITGLYIISLLEKAIKLARADERNQLVLDPIMYNDIEVENRLKAKLKDAIEKLFNNMESWVLPTDSDYDPKGITGNDHFIVSKRVLKEKVLALLDEEAKG